MPLKIQLLALCLSKPKLLALKPLLRLLRWDAAKRSARNANPAQAQAVIALKVTKKSLASNAKDPSLTKRVILVKSVKAPAFSLASLRKLQILFVSKFISTWILRTTSKVYLTSMWLHVSKRKTPKCTQILFVIAVKWIQLEAFVTCALCATIMTFARTVRLTTFTRSTPSSR